MKTLSENFENLAVLNEIEMSKVLGGTYAATGTTIEDEDAWL